MVSNAILEIWKKETGSLSPVDIEGTICITAGSGRTTVLQIANHFAGTIPQQQENEGPTFHTPKRKMAFRNPYLYNSLSGGSSGESFSSPSIFSPSSDEPITPSPQPMVMGYRPRLFNPASIVSHRHSRKSSEQSFMDISNNAKENSQTNNNNDTTGKENYSNRSEESGIDVNSGRNSQLLAGTGFYSRNGEDVEEEGKKDTSESNSDVDVVNNDSIDDRDDDEDKERAGPLMSTPKARSSSINDPPPPTPDVNALDLSSSSRKDHDLVLSPPQDYTAQVRDVIQPKILSSRQNSSENTRGSTEDADSVPPSPLPQSTSSHGDEAEVKTRSSPAAMTSPLTIPSLGHPGHHPINPLMSLSLNHSPSMLPLVAYPGGPLIHKPLPASPILPAPLHDMYVAPRHPAPLISPDLYRPPSRPSSTSSSASFDQNNNNGKKKDGPQPTNSDNGEQKIFRCQYCEKTFLFKSKFIEHMPVHSNNRPFSCHVCTRTYKYKYDLRVHLRTHLGIPTKSTTCPYCSVKFETNKMLRNHITDYHQGQEQQSILLSPSDAVPAPVPRPPPAPSPSASVHSTPSVSASTATENEAMRGSKM